MHIELAIKSEAEYLEKRGICNKAAAWWQANAVFNKDGSSSLPREACQHPDYAACTNEIRGQVEQYELLRDLPEVIFAYIGEPMQNGMGVDRVLGQTYPVTVWTGLPIGWATAGRKWRVSSYIGTHMQMFYARIGGREYIGRGFGSGMCIRLRETKASKRNRGAA